MYTYIHVHIHIETIRYIGVCAFQRRAMLGVDTWRCAEAVFSGHLEQAKSKREHLGLGGAGWARGVQPVSPQAAQSKKPDNFVGIAGRFGGASV